MAEHMSNRELVESFYEAVGEKAANLERGISTGDTDHLRRIFAEKIEWIHSALGGTFRGAESVIEDDGIEKKQRTGGGQCPSTFSTVRILKRV
jgi:hypothetical protein